MARFAVLFRCLGAALCAKGIKALVGVVPFGEALYDVAEETFKQYRQHHQEQALRAELEAAAQASLDEVRQAAGCAVTEVAAAQPAEVRERLVDYLTRVPATVRQTLRRVTDPEGRTLPGGFLLSRPEHLLPLLPPRLPRFKVGDRPVGVGNWELVELLGVGGFGEVWKAQHPRLRSIRPVALKFCLDPALAGALRHEAAVLDRLMRQGDVPGIVKLQQAYLDGEPACLEYEYVAGGDLSGLVRDWQALPAEKRVGRATGVIQTLARAVAHFHRLDPPIVHRDLKPANVLLAPNGDGKMELRITDFGIGGIAARQELAQVQRGATTRAGVLLTGLRGSYTPLYASPQQMRGDAPDPRDDVFALGVVWYQLLTGDLTRGVGTDYADDLRELGVSADLIELLGKCVAARPERRLDSAAVLADRLRAVEAREPARAIVGQPRTDPPVALDAIELELSELETHLYAGKRASAFLVVRVRQRLADWRAGAEMQHAASLLLVGMCCEGGIGVPRDYEQAVSCYRRAAEMGSLIGLVSLGRMYEDGKGIAQDHEEAVRLYRGAAEQGHARGQDLLGEMYQGGKGVPRDDKVAIGLFRLAAAQGYAPAQFNLGHAYDLGLGVPKSNEEALHWYRQAARQGHDPAQHNLARMYMHGQGVKRDYEEAIRLLRLAAERGNNPARKTLGQMYRDGTIVNRDDREAVRLFRLAAEEGDADAEAYLAWMHQQGRGVPVDHKEAVRLFLQAARKNASLAQVNLGWHYEEGKGVARDVAEAARWYERAAEQGQDFARKRLEALRSPMGVLRRWLKS
jgi:TPR repeat protein